MNLDQLDFPDSHFNKIICIQVLQFIKGSKRVFEEFKRVLKRKGKLFLIVPGVDYYGKIGEKNPKGLIARKKGFDKETIISLSTGFKIEKTIKLSGSYYKNIALIQSFYFKNKFIVLHFFIFPFLNFICKLNSILSKSADRKTIYLYIMSKVEE